MCDCVSPNQVHSRHSWTSSTSGKFLYYFLPPDLSGHDTTIHLPFHQGSTFSRHSSVLNEGLPYIRPPSTRAGSKSQNMCSGEDLNTQAAETRATKFRTRATTILRAVHIHKRRNLHLTTQLFKYNFAFRLSSKANLSTPHRNFMTSLIHWLMASILMVFLSTRSKIPVIFLIPTTSTAMGVQAFSGTAILLSFSLR